MLASSKRALGHKTLAHFHGFREPLKVNPMLLRQLAVSVSHVTCVFDSDPLRSQIYRTEEAMATRRRHLAKGLGRQRGRLGKSRGEQNESACPQVADASADCTEGPGWTNSRPNNDAILLGL